MQDVYVVINIHSLSADGVFHKVELCRESEVVKKLEQQYYKAVKVDSSLLSAMIELSNEPPSFTDYTDVQTVTPK